GTAAGGGRALAGCFQRFLVLLNLRLPGGPLPPGFLLLEHGQHRVGAIGAVEGRCRAEEASISLDLSPPGRPRRRLRLPRVRRRMVPVRGGRTWAGVTASTTNDRRPGRGACVRPTGSSPREGK